MRRARGSFGVVAGGAALLLLVAACGSSNNAGSSGSSSSTTTSGSSSSSGAATGLKKDAKLAAMVPKSVSSDGKVVVATDPTYAPMEFIGSDNTTLIGVDPELGQALGQILGIQFQFQKATFDGIIPGLASGKYELGMSSFTDTKQREKVVDFVTYFKAGTALLVPKGNPKHLSPTGDSLCGLTVGAEKGTIQSDSDMPARSKKCVADGKKPLNEKTYPGQDGVNLALSTGRIDAALADSGVAGYMAEKSHGSFQTVGKAYSTAPYGIAVPKNDGQFTKALQGAMQKLINSPEYMKILKKWDAQQGAITTSQINVAKS
ncbi:MAG TPA: ABC transporter substrate-binding protein [Segeticoccus sp.]|uniref:ABC transporter substrate-binding protein n=1 Tax=Segeticoccus sp. TaxID=2706531 RepID=UPI002D7FAC7F|nr:ABC transporter substrate-binding protein [Segeticoccus sp.]HET8601768.1 ABC transporter substrate-binding protein [Segeticoccus sp.]